MQKFNTLKNEYVAVMHMVLLKSIKSLHTFTKTDNVILVFVYVRYRPGLRSVGDQAISPIKILAQIIKSQN